MRDPFLIDECLSPDLVALAHAREWLELQRLRSVLPDPRGLLVESFPRQEREYLVACCFEGRNAHQTLSMLLTRRMERMGLKPLGFVATDYVLGVWSLNAVTAPDVAALFDEDMLGDDLEARMDESSLLKRTFRNVAVIAGLGTGPRGDRGGVSRKLRVRPVSGRQFESSRVA